MKKNANHKLLQLILLFTCILFFCLFVVIDKPVICVDSPSYISMEVSREPLYPLFLAFFRLFLGDPACLMAAGLCQSIFWGIAIWYASLWIGKICTQDAKRQIMIQLFSISIQLGVALLNRFAAKRGSMYSECIMTESLAMPLYLLFSIWLWRCFMCHNRWDMLRVAISAYLLVSIRSQMLIVLLLWGACTLFYHLILPKTRSLRLFCIHLLALCMVFLLVKVTDCGYNQIVRGKWMTHTGAGKGSFCTLFYATDEEDLSLFTDPVMTGLYQTLYEEASARGVLYQSLPSDTDWLTRGEHFAESYDIIGFEIMMPVIRSYLETQGITDVVEMNIEMDHLISQITRRLLTRPKGILLQIYFINIWKALVSSIARVMPVVMWLCIPLYGVFLLLYCRLKIRGVDRPDSLIASPSQAPAPGMAAVNRDGFNVPAICVLAEITLGGILINSFVVAAIIFPQPRYTIYGMGLFYTVLVILIYSHRFLPKGKNL
ncbi:MAG: hypothetical protein IJT34_08195 [Butyrivibrio sp.]|nr:hypothetical protein [Butyrivibrio sp.]